MKIYKSIILGALGVMSLASCDSYLDINTNPNSATADAASYEYRLPWCLHYLQAGYEIGACVDSYFTGLVTSTAAREGGASRWNLSAATRANIITQWFLVPCASNLQAMYDKAMAAGAYHYAGAAKFMRAYGFMNIIDHMGECPYTDALGSSTSPVYDTGKTVFMGCLGELDEAIELFSRTQDASAKPLSFGDNWNNGDVSKWIKLCYLLKARWLNHLSKKQAGSYKDGKYDADAILDCLSKAQQSNADNTVLRHTDTNGVTKDVEDWGETVEFNSVFSCIGMNNGRYFVTKTFYDNLTNFDGKGVEDPRADKFIPWQRSVKSASSPAAIKWSADGKWRRSLGVDIVNEDIYSNGTGPVQSEFTKTAATFNGVDYPAYSWYCKTDNEERQGDTIYVHGKSSSKGYDNNKDLLYRRGGVDESAVSGVFSVRPDSYTYFGSYWEACFIKAEVLMRKGDKPGAFAAYKAGIEANIQAVEERCAEWVAGDPTLANCPSFAPATQEAINNYLSTAIGTAADITMSKIMTQKLMTMMWSSEQWNDMRRFDYDPQIFMNYGKPKWYSTHGTALTFCPEGSSPRRLPQATYELNFNSANLDAIGAQVPGALDLPMPTDKSVAQKWYNSDQIRTLHVWWDSTQE
jgi:hypothetical protein